MRQTWDDWETYFHCIGSKVHSLLLNLLLNLLKVHPYFRLGKDKCKILMKRAKISFMVNCRMFNKWLIQFLEVNFCTIYPFIIAFRDIIALKKLLTLNVKQYANNPVLMKHQVLSCPRFHTNSFCSGSFS